MQWWGYAATAIFWVLVILGIAVAATYLARDRLARRGASSQSGSAAAVLAARFACGEISETEYRDRLAVVRETGQQ